MIQKLFITLLLTVGLSTLMQAQLQVPALSPSASIEQTVGLTEIEISYSRPSARGRTIFGSGGILPYNEIWRAGANAATKISFSDSVILSGQELEKGDYVLLTKPGKTSWAVYFYPYESSNWSSYLEKTPALTISTKSQTVSGLIETFTISLDALSIDSAQLVLAWEYTKVVLPIEVEIKERVTANIEKVMAGPSTNDYFQAALFLHETNSNLETALGYIQKVTSNENARFFQVYREAAILADLNRKKEAIQAAKRSLELSRKAGNKDFVRLNEKLIGHLSK